MKRALKVIIPLILILALLGTGCWFFLYSRTDLTTGFLIDQARSMTASGRYGRAITYYSWAWALEPNRDDIAIALSDTYIADGNYTKAEYTLVKAISQNPDQTDLYVALCQTYVAQDKLLDAVQMLDRTTDADVKAQLDVLRPSAPVLTPESGFYSEYIEVSAKADADAIYITTNGEYPSSEADLYTEPLVLQAGETPVLAIAVDENGLVSPAVLMGYTIAGVVEEVTFADPAVEQTVREQLNLSADAPIMSDVIWSITHLTLPDTLKDLSDLSMFTGLQSLTIQNISGLDFSILAELPALRELDLSGCTISSNGMDAIGSLTELERLALNGCALTDVNVFSRLTKLQEIRLADNSLTDIGVLSLMLELRIVDLSNNPLSSIAALSTCGKLENLNITGCLVGSLGCLTGKTQMQVLIASYNQITSIDELIDCKQISVIEIGHNQIENIAVLAKLPKLTHFEGENNHIADVPDFDEHNCQLIVFGIDYNEVEDVSGLAGIDTLNYLYADYNQIKDLTMLADNINMVQINAWDNPVSEESIEALEEQSIILNYNPSYEAPEGEEEESEE